MTTSQTFPSRSLTLLKPGAYKLGLLERVPREIDRNGLTIINSWRVNLSIGDVMELYNHLHPISLAMAFARDRFVFATLDVFEVEGADAVEKMLRIKRELRRELGHQDIWSSLLHSPDSDEDYLREREIFWGARIWDDRPNRQ